VNEDAEKELEQQKLESTKALNIQIQNNESALSDKAGNKSF
jgi:hypothetical protein